jgi:NNP family nitrate/nitrite transporter-like MFS transporter
MISKLFKASELNPINNKARTLPIFNLRDKHVLNFHLSWLGFFIAFFSWFAFPPLMAITLKKDLNLTKTDIANSSILGLTSTLLVRVITGPLCDKYGPRKVMAGLLLVGAIPTLFAGLAQDATGLMIIRFLIGVLGGTFVPCQVWTTTFFDKNIVGTANAFAGGWGNAGGGVVFFVMPAVVEWFIEDFDMTPSKAWRVAFPSVPFVLITLTAILVLALGSDCPNGHWSKRYIPEKVDLECKEVRFKESVDTLDPLVKNDDHDDHTLSGFQVAFGAQTLLAALPYACTFGAELAVEGIISTLYVNQAAKDGLVWGETTAGAWAATFELLNVITRPLGGILSDLIYHKTNVNYKKYWMIFLGVGEGICFLVIGFNPNLPVYGLIGVMTVLAVFMEAGNGANFALVPHLNPSRNGLVSGMVGATGNLGGIIFGLVFRFTDGMFNSMWICGIIILVFHLVIIGIPIQPNKKQSTNKMVMS